LNRAYDVDPGEPEVIASAVARMRAAGCSPLLEIVSGAIGDQGRATLGELGLTRRWEVVTLWINLAQLPERVASDVTVRSAPSQAPAAAVGRWCSSLVVLPFA
jgi:hypothetical protein